MDLYITEWLNLTLRFLHVITGIAWIGASFYFIWLDNHLQTPPQWKADKGIKGDLWAIHGGGFYEVAKYQLAPPTLPHTLHWFKWEAYATWLSGILLLTVIYYIGAHSYLIDKRIADLSQWQAITIGLTVIFASWFIYDGLCRTPLADHSLLLGILLLLLGTLLTYGLTRLFSARGAYIHIGAVIGTLMAGNVFRVIIPGQKALVEAVKAGGTPDPKWAQSAKLRSTHNTYTTLPLIFIMISNHYPMTYNHSFNWAILIAIVIITAAARQYFVLRHKGVEKPIILLAAVLATAILAIFIAPPSSVETHSGVNNKSLATEVEQVLKQRCSSCHSSAPTDDTFKIAPAGVVLDDLSAMQQWAPRIQARVIDSGDMPFMNKTSMTDAERRLVAQWLAQGATTEK